MGTSNWLGTQMQMKITGNNESFDFLTEHVIGEMWNILNGRGLVSTRQVKRFNRNSFNWIQASTPTSNSTTWYMEEWVNNLGTPVLYVKIYSPANPHISIASSDDFKMGVTPGGFTGLSGPGNGSKLVGGYSDNKGYQPRYSGYIRLA